MRASLIGSGVIHAAILFALFYVRTPISLIVPGPETVQVALVDPNALMPTAPPQPETPPAPVVPDVKPVEDTGVKLAPPPPKRKKPEPPREEQPPPVEATTLPSASVGTGGLRGDLTVELRDFEFTYYLVLVRNKIAGNWTPPAGIATGGRRVRSVVYFRISRGGELTGERLETSSGLEFFDRAALRAVALSDPLPPLPLGFGGGELGVHFGFDWETP